MVRRVVTIEPRKMIIENVPAPVCGSGHARIAVEAVGLCGSDYHLYSGDHPYARFPQIQGHEFSGRIVEFGPDYDGPLALGERVAVEPLIPCGACFACDRGRYNCCAELKVMGAHVPGALAEQVIVSWTSLYPVGDLSAELAALVEPVSIGLHAVRRGQVAADDQVVVIGAGPIGLTATLAAADLGAQVMVVDRVASRLHAAHEMGAQIVVDSASEDTVAAANRWTRGRGAAVVIDATGVPALIRSAFEIVAHSGAIVIVGISDEEVSVPVIDYSRKEVSVYGSRNNAGLFADAVDLVRRNVDRVGQLITHRFPLAQVADAISFAQANPEVVEKVVITMGEQT